MAKPNYAFAKRQRELAKKQKKEEKLKRKAEHGDAPEGFDVPDQDEAAGGESAQPAQQDDQSAA